MSHKLLAPCQSRQGRGNFEQRISLQHRDQFQNTHISLMLLQLDPSDHLQIDVKIEFDDHAIGTQAYNYIHKDGSFAAELACARTFCQLRDVELMQNAGLALGGSLNNAIVVDDGIILNEGGLRVEREFARHKVLDCLGDLFLYQSFSLRYLLPLE